MTEILDWIIYILEVVGLWMLFEKCGQEGWKSLIPFYNTYCLGKCGHDEEDGKWAAIAAIVSMIFSALAGGRVRPGLFLITRLITHGIFGILACVFSIIELVFLIRIYAALIARFDRPKAWLIGWFFFDGITAVIWGFAKSFQPKDGSYSG